jgi:hypothetical protein
LVPWSLFLLSALSLFPLVPCAFCAVLRPFPDFIPLGDMTENCS